jgi:hypothetical protein
MALNEVAVVGFAYGAQTMINTHTIPFYFTVYGLFAEQSIWWAAGCTGE